MELDRKVEIIRDADGNPEWVKMRHAWCLEIAYELSLPEDGTDPADFNRMVRKLDAVFNEIFSKSSDSIYAAQAEDEPDEAKIIRLQEFRYDTVRLRDNPLNYATVQMIQGFIDQYAPILAEEKWDDDEWLKNHKRDIRE